MLAAIATTVLFSISVVCGHRSARKIGGTEANFWRAALATLILGAWSYGFGKGLEGKAFPVFLLSGIVGIGFGDVAFFQALPRLGSRLAMLLVQCLTAPFGALIEWYWMGTGLSSRQIVFGLLILIGVGIALKPHRGLGLTRRQLWTGSIFGVCAALGGAGGAVLSRKAYAIVQSAGEHIDPFNAGYQRMLGGLFLAGVVLLVVKRRVFLGSTGLPREPIPGIIRSKWVGVWYWIVLNSLAGQTFGVSCMQKAFETTPAGIVLSIIASAPIIVIPMAYLVDRERPTMQSVLGACVAVGGVIGLVLLG